MSPTNSPGFVIYLALEPSIAFASIMSPSLAALSFLRIMMFSGAILRCMICFSWAISSACAIYTPTVSANRQSSILSVPNFSISLVSGSPSTYSMAYQQVSPCLPAA